MLHMADHRCQFVIRPYVSEGFLMGMSVCLTSLRYVNPCQDTLVSAAQRGLKARTFLPRPILSMFPTLLCDVHSDFPVITFVKIYI